MKQHNQTGAVDILNIQGEDIPEIDDALNQLLAKGMSGPQRILEGASKRLFGDTKPYAQTFVELTFDNEQDLRRCVRLLRWSDERLLAMGSVIAWSWDATVREGMTIRFRVAWYDKEFFQERKDSFRDKNHLSYFRMFGKSTSDMQIYTEVYG